jgi:hypothetical protein
MSRASGAVICHCDRYQLHCWNCHLWIGLRRLRIWQLLRHCEPSVLRVVLGRIQVECGSSSDMRHLPSGVVLRIGERQLHTLCEWNIRCCEWVFDMCDMPSWNRLGVRFWIEEVRECGPSVSAWCSRHDVRLCRLRIWQLLHSQCAVLSAVPIGNVLQLLASGCLR